MKNLPALPRSLKNEEKVPLQVEVNKLFWIVIEREMKKLKLTKRQVVEFGLKAFLIKTNPIEASNLGITAED